MQTRSSLQRRSNSESSDRVVAHIKPRPWGDETHEQPQTVQPKNSGFDFKNADWFSHDPGPRSPVRVFNSIQAKLKVGAPNDVYEQEADRVAEQVMSTPDSATQQPIQREAILEEKEELQTKPLAATITPLVQREAILEEEKEEELQTKPLSNSIQREEMPEEEKEEEEIQTKRSLDAGFQSGSNLESRLSNSQGGGSPLSEEVRSFMEPRFGADFSQVRVHTGNEAVQMNRDLNAQAFTHKQDVYFGAGKTPAKDALTAHELTHVVQQTGTGQKEFLQRQGKGQKKVVSFDHKLKLNPIELKDKDGKIISTQSANLELSLKVEPLYTAKTSRVNFSFGELKLATVLDAVSEEANGATNTTASVSGGVSLTIVNVNLTSSSLFLPPGSALTLGGKLEGTVSTSDGTVKPKMKPKIGLTIPLSKKTYLELEATPGVEYGGKLNVSF